MQNDSVNTPQSQNNNRSSINTKGKKLLVIEDDFLIRELYNSVLTESGYIVDSAADGQEALTKINTQTYDMILLDLVLPKITGLDLLRDCRLPLSKARNTPVFLITNLGQDNIIKEAFKVGADGYILKSKVTPKQLVAELDTFFATGKK